MQSIETCRQEKKVFESGLSEWHLSSVSVPCFEMAFAFNKALLEIACTFLSASSGTFEHSDVSSIRTRTIRIDDAIA